MRMNYVIHCGGMPFSGDTIKTASLGGSETAAYYQARELASRGHRVILFTNCPDEGVWDGVTYCWAGQISQSAPLGDRFSHFACNTPHDVLIVQRHPLAFHKDYASKINVLQMHDLALRRAAPAFNAGAARIDLVTGVSEFHVKQIEEVYGTRAGIVKSVPNGVDLSLYAGLEPLPADHPITQRADSFKLLYQSRPERGLEHLLRPDGIMEQLLHAGSKAHLFYCAYANTVEHMQAYYEQLNEYAAKLANVTNLGALTKAQLARVQASCDVLVYPTEFEEVSCITAMEAMAAGLPFLSSAHAALPETCKDSGSVLIPLTEGVQGMAADEDRFCARIQALDLDTTWRAELRLQQIAAAETRSWEHAVDILEERVSEVFRGRGSSKARMARHLIEHSDISALDEVKVNTPNGYPAEGAIFHASMIERFGMYAFAKSHEAMVVHYQKWEGMNCDRMAERGLDPDREQAGLVQTTRYRGLAHLVGSSVADKARSGLPVRVLEFGCAHGHITMALAEQFPQVRFTGVDFMERSVGLARETASARGLENVEFRVGSLDTLADMEAFDAVVAPEVVEHIWDYRDALQKLMGAVAIGGSLITTTPNGRWEWSGRDWWHKGREHLHHFERDDLKELFAEFPHEILHAPAGNDPAGGPLGSWVAAVRRVEGAEIGRIDYVRKLACQAPRDTVSLCMIARDAQETIGACLRSVVGWVDEVVIAIDKDSGDHTRERIAEVQQDFPHVAWKVIEGESPLKIGFDEARNRTLDESCGDWILWMDADEQMIGAQNIWRLLRPGTFNGYAIAQNHMSQAPAERVSTDYPCRLFRRDSGARFYGVVHEHPEVVIGKAIPHTYQLSDVSICHYGYATEAHRRGRYQRNFPLLKRDLEKHPNRTINKFLYLRDLAQAIAFEGEQTGGVSPTMVSSAHQVVDLFENLIDNNPMMRMTLDAVPYYSTAVAILGNGFRVKLSVQTSKEEFAGASASADIDGLFHSRETYSRLLARIAQETTRNYEGKYI
jgi:2-polyprenyl-3-methyl-5-hydroxy-6-metoxy-1,4-benzoquinol methylase/glycosyltransferase involved in cell wall biosynthesis